MQAEIGLERCFSFINCQLQPSRFHGPPYRDGDQRRAVTISRQAASGAHEVAEHLGRLLQEQEPPGACPWTVFDRNLVEKVLEDHHLPHRLARFMHEDKISEVSDTMDELFGLHPPSWTLVHKTAETILHLAELGNVIIIGRGANVITKKLPHVFHVRLVGSLDARIKHLQTLESLTVKASRDRLQEEDRARKRYVRKYFNWDVDDPLLYHLVINTDLVPYGEAARMIAHAMAPVAVSQATAA